MTVAPAKELDDLRQVIHAYNELAGRLEASQEALQREVMRLNGELAEKNVQLARKNRLEVLGEMAAGVAHEIRNPLGGIELYAGLIAREAGDGEKVRKWAAKIKNATADLSRIVGEILDFTRPLKPQARDIPLSQAVGAALELASGTLSERRIRVANRCGRSRAVVRGDANLLQRAFLNVILNAADAMRAGGVLTVRARTSEIEGADAWRLSFSDTGCGISGEDLAKIFDPFFTRKEGGTGLGLAMTARIAAAHGGSVSAANTHEGGAALTFLLPAGRVEKAEADSDMEAQQCQGSR